jgi:hypothetical protein
MIHIIAHLFIMLPMTSILSHIFQFSYSNLLKKLSRWGIYRRIVGDLTDVYIRISILHVIVMNILFIDISLYL